MLATRKQIRIWHTMASVTQGPINNVLQPMSKFQSHMYGGLRYQSIECLAQALTNGNIPPGTVGRMDLSSSLQVICIFRYIPDEALLTKHFGFSLKGDGYAEKEMYDLILSDGLQRARVVLHPRLNKFVRTGELNLLAHIECSSWKHVVLQHIRAPVLMGLSVESHRIEVVANFNTDFNSKSRVSSMMGIHYHPKLLAADNQGVIIAKDPAFWRRPLVPGRSFYLSMSADDCPNSAVAMPMPYSPLDGILCQHILLDPDDGHGIRMDTLETHRTLLREDIATNIFVDNEWMVSTDVLVNLEDYISARYQRHPMTIKEVIDLTQNSLENRKDRVSSETKGEKARGILLGVVTSKSALHISSTTDASSRSWAHFTFELTDSSGTTQISCWNHLCRLIYHVVQPGAILLVQYGRYKPCKVLSTRRADMISSHHEFSLELSTLPDEITFDSLSKSPFVVQVAEDNAICGASNIRNVFSPADNALADFMEIQKLAWKYVATKQTERPRVTIAGLVTYVGRREILHTVRGDRFEFRWIKVANPDFSEELVVQMYANSDPESYMNISAGHWLVVTNVFLGVQVISSQSPLSVCLRSTKDTSYFLFKIPNSPSTPQKKSNDPFEAHQLHPKLNRLLPRAANLLRKLIKTWQPQLIDAAIVYDPSMPKIASEMAGSSRRNKRLRRSANTEKDEESDNFIPQSAKDFIFLKNPSHELDLQHRSVMSFLFSPNMLALKPRFEPFKLSSVTHLHQAEFYNAMLVGETQHYRIQTFVQTVDLRLLRKSGMFYLAFSLGTSSTVDSGDSVEALMKRNPILGPCPTRLEMTDAKFALSYYQTRLPSLDLKGLINGGASQSCPLWVQAHKVSFYEIEFDIMGEFNPDFDDSDL